MISQVRYLKREKLRLPQVEIASEKQVSVAFAATISSRIGNKDTPESVAISPAPFYHPQRDDGKARIYHACAITDDNVDIQSKIRSFVRSGACLDLCPIKGFAV